MIETWRAIDKPNPRKRAGRLKSQTESENSGKRDKSVANRSLIVTSVNTTPP